MNTPRRALAFAAAAVLLGVVAAPAFAQAPDEPSVDLANNLQGRWNGAAGPGNQLHLVVQPRNASTNNTFVFDLTIQGKYEERTISVHGTLHIDREGRSARLGWINTDNPPRGGSGRGACDFPVKRDGDAFQGQTLRDQCAMAFQVPSPGTWTVRVEPGTITIKSIETGETLRFVKAPKS